MDKYDVFISYSHEDSQWVRDWLLLRLEGAGLKVCIDFRDFDIGMPSLVNMEKAVELSGKTLLVLTPNWFNLDFVQICCI
ncbi:toll/interleukin-1 receptor domain-containing protein [Candidatus Poribacteria bacterium]